MKFDLDEVWEPGNTELRLFDAGILLQSEDMFSDTCWQCKVTRSLVEEACTEWYLVLGDSTRTKSARVVNATEKPEGHSFDHTSYRSRDKQWMGITSTRI